jgi:hypothetical protein
MRDEKLSEKYHKLTKAVKTDVFVSKGKLRNEQAKIPRLSL